MTMVGGFDVHRKQITFDYVDTDRVGALRGRSVRRRGRRCGAGWASTARPGMRSSRWRAAPGGGMWSRSWPRRVWWRIWVIRPRSRRCGVRRSAPRPTGPMRGCCARCCWRAGYPESWIPPAHVLEMRTLGRLYCTLMDERRAWQQRIHAQLFHQGCPPIKALLIGAGRDALAGAELSAAGRQYVDTALRRIDELTVEIDPVRRQLINFARRQVGCQALQARQYGVGWLCAAIMWAEIGDARRFHSSDQLVRFAGHGRHRVLLGRQTLTGASVPAGFPGAAVGDVRGG